MTDEHYVCRAAHPAAVRDQLVFAQVLDVVAIGSFADPKQAPRSSSHHLLPLDGKGTFNPPRKVIFPMSHQCLSHIIHMPWQCLGYGSSWKHWSTMESTRHTCDKRMFKRTL